MFVVGMGLCLNNALAVFRGLVLKGGEFVRTPKSGSDQRQRRISSDRPIKDSLWLIELILGAYMLVSFAFYLLHFRWAFSNETERISIRSESGLMSFTVAHCSGG